MVKNWGVVGHENQISFLERSARQGRLAHAYVFSGPASVGKKTTAVALAKILLCPTGTGCGDCKQCLSIESGSNPDVMMVNGEDSLKIEQVRELVYKLSLKSYAGGAKVAIIDPAEAMTIEASNALLKAMEEPTAGTHLILVTSNAYQLLPTITSRAQRINFGLVPEDRCRDILPADLDPRRADLIAKLAAGRPGVAKRLLEDPDFESGLAETEGYHKAFCGSDPLEKVKAAQSLAEREHGDIRTFLEYSLSRLEKDLLRDGNPLIARRMSALAAAIRFLDGNANPKLLLYNLMLNT